MTSEVVFKEILKQVLVLPELPTTERDQHVDLIVTGKAASRAAGTRE